MQKQPDNDRTRPAANGTGSNVISDGDVTSIRLASDAYADTARCRRCHHPLTAPRSVAIGIGPYCRQLEHSDLIQNVFREVLAAC